MHKDNNTHDAFNNTQRNEQKYEVWAADQSNTDGDNTITAGSKGSYLWIWDSTSIKKQLKGGPDAKPLGCLDNNDPGPCDMLDVFPHDLAPINGPSLGESAGFGRLHGVLRDPQNMYITANFFAPSGGYVGIISTKTKEAIALFRVTNFSYMTGDNIKTARSNHLSFWTTDGLSIIVSNLHGKAIERIDIARNKKGIIKRAKFNKSASIGLGCDMDVADKGGAVAFAGENAFGRQLIGETSGSYGKADLLDLTPNGLCKENGCNGTTRISQAGGRGNNLPICTIPTENGNVYVTLAGGGLFVLDGTSTPMKIVGEYGKNVIYGAGVFGAEVENQVFINQGVSASPVGSDQSTFVVFSFDDTKYSSDGINPENQPMPERIYQDNTNTKTIGNTEGESGISSETNPTGQIPGTTTRRDSHGMAVTIDGKYLHVVDRVQNVIETFDTETKMRATYDLVSKDGKSGRDGPAGPCFAKSVLDSEGLTLNDPAPDLIDTTPDGEFIVVGLRGPAPVSVPHAAQGSCPGVGIVRLTEGGKLGKLVDVLRTTNHIDTHTVGNIPGGHPYSGAERSDVHGAIVVTK